MRSSGSSGPTSSPSMPLQHCSPAPSAGLYTSTHTRWRDASFVGTWPKVLGHGQVCCDVARSVGVLPGVLGVARRVGRGQACCARPGVLGELHSKTYDYHCYLYCTFIYIAVSATSQCLLALRYVNIRLFLGMHDISAVISLSADVSHFLTYRHRPDK